MQVHLVSFGFGGV